MLTKRLYTRGVMHEWRRLVQDPFHRLELDTTLRFLKKYLPKKALVLDAGGGSGRYSIELCKLGYRVVLLDLTPANLALAKKQIKKAKVGESIESIAEGSIVDLSRFKDNTFDAVLCLGGALSHVHPEKDRRKAINELIRVAKHNFPVFVSVIGKYAVLMEAPRLWPNDLQSRKYLFRWMFKGDDYRFMGRHFCHFFTLDELERLFDDKKVRILEEVGLEGLASADHDALNRLYKQHPKAYKIWTDAHEKMRTERFVVDASQHMLIILRKK